MDMTVVCDICSLVKKISYRQYKTIKDEYRCLKCKMRSKGADISKRMKGRKLPEKTKKLLSEKMKAYYKNFDNRIKTQIYVRDKIDRKKISKNTKKLWQNPAYRDKIINALKNPSETLCEKRAIKKILRMKRY